MIASLRPVYCEGWDPGRREVAGRLTAATARDRDRAGGQYSVALVEPGAGTVVAVLDVAWGHHFARCWRLDDLGRRTTVDEYRVHGDRLFLRRRAEWGYDDPGQPEFDPERASHVEVTYHPGGTAQRSTRPNGRHGGAIETTVVIPVDDLYSDVPRFGEWAGLIRLDAELVEGPDPEADEPADPPWEPAAPMRPDRVDLVFRPGVRWALAGSDDVVVTEVVEAGVVRLTSGRVVAADPGWLDGRLKPFTATVPPGDYRVELAVARFAGNTDHRRVAAARLVVSTEPVASWDMALTDGQDPVLLGDGEFYGFGVDSGVAGFVDGDVLDAMEAVLEASYDETAGAIPDGGSVVVREPASGATLVAFHSGWGDGAYPTWLGRTAGGEVACFVADLLVLHRAVVAPDEQTGRRRSDRP